MKAEQNVEILDVIDENDNVIGSAPKEEIYSKKLFHRIVHIFVIHPETSEIYLQERSQSVSFLPRYLCTSAGGHVSSGEDYHESAIRELHEEIGLTSPITEVDSFVFTGENGHRRSIKTFITKSSDGFDFTDGEASGGKFYSVQNVKALIDKDEKIHPQLKACFNRLYDKGLI